MLDLLATCTCNHVEFFIQSIQTQSMPPASLHLLLHHASYVGLHLPFPNVMLPFAFVAFTCSHFFKLPVLFVFCSSVLKPYLDLKDYIGSIITGYYEMDTNNLRQVDSFLSRSVFIKARHFVDL